MDHRIEQHFDEPPTPTAVFFAAIDEPTASEGVSKAHALGESVALEAKSLNLAFETLPANPPSPFTHAPPQSFDF